MCVCVCERQLVCCLLPHETWPGLVLCYTSQWVGVGVRMGAGWYRAIKPVSDTPSASHSLAVAIVVWNLRNALDRLAVPA